VSTSLDAADDTVATPVRRRARVPLLVWAITALHVALLLAYTVLYPAYLGYDEPQHVDMVVALRAGDGWPDPGERALSEGVGRSSDPVYGGGLVPALERPYRADDVPERGARPSLEDLGGNAPSTGGELPNQMVQHPPLWYATGAAVVALLPGSGGWPYDAYVAVLRLVSVLMVAPLPLLAWALARRLSRDDVVATTAAALPLAVPGLTRIGASAGNDALVVLTFAAVLVALARALTGDASRRTAVAAGALTTLALLTKGFALVLPAVVLAAYAVAWLRRRTWSVLRSAAIALAVSAVGWLWWLRNLLEFGALQPSGFGREAASRLRGTPREAGDNGSPGEFASTFSEVTMTRFWAGLGVPEPPTFSVGLAAVLTVLAAAGVLAGVVAGVRSRPGAASRRLPLLVVLLPFVLLLVPLVRADLLSYQRYEGPGTEVGVHGRYLYGAVAGLAAVAAVGYRRLLAGHARWLPALAVLAAVAVQAWALWLVFTDLWAPGGALSAGLGALLAVSPWPPVVTALPLSAAAVLAAVTLVLAVRPARVSA
jgi:small subunit ribosomal protein S36